MRIMFIDPGTTRIGWAFGQPDQGPTHGTYEPPKTGANLGWLMTDVGSWLEPLLKKQRIELVAYESPILVAGNGFPTIRKVAAIGAEIERNCYRLGIACEEVAAASVRAMFLGRGNTPKKSEDIKAAVIRQCHILGWRPGTDDAADALAGWTYMIGLKCPKIPMKTGSLL